MNRSGLALPGLCILSSIAAAQPAELIPLPDTFTPLAVSADGNVVVGSYSNPLVPAFWSQATGVVVLRDAAGQPVTGKAWAASADGAVVVGTFKNSANAQVPFRWTAATGVVQIPDVQAGSNGYDVSADGSVIVGQGLVNGNRGFVWTQSAGTAALPTLPGMTTAWGISVSPNGQFITGHGVMNGNLGAIMVWDLPHSTATVVATSDGPINSVFGIDVNADGQAVAGRMFVDGNERAVLVTSRGVQVMDPIQGQSLTRTTSMTPDARWVVGYSASGLRDHAAFIYSEGLGTVSLQSWLQDHWSMDLTDITLTDAYGISADGRVIVGLGTPTNWLVRLPAASPADFNADSTVDFQDLYDFLECFEGQSLLPVSSADINHDGFVDFFDVDEFMANF